MFVLDGNWYNQNYKSKSVDYWVDRNPTQPSYQKKHEAEDRIFSKTPSIPIDGVSSVHILIKPDAKNEYFGGWARTVIINAKKRGIQVYLYDKESNFRQLDPSKSIPITNNPLLKGPQHISRGSRSFYKPKGYLYQWIQLITASAKNQLATDADKLRYSIIYNNYGDTQQGLANDMSNARKPSSGVDRDNAVKIIDFMRKNRINTLKDLVELLTAKWKKISDEDNQNKAK
jgi:hypothetical protein